jgi:hypothetical protein
MFNRLRQKWRVSGWRLLLILITFAVGGSLSGIAAKQVMTWLGVGSPWLYVPIYIIVVTIIWPLAVLLVSIPLGQFRFFVSYLRRMVKR